MWVVSGCLDGLQVEIQDETKSKLLKPGETYQVTRKYQNGQSLVVNSKKVGGDHALVMVGEHSAENAENLDMIPTLQFKNSRPKELMYKRMGSDANRIVASKGTEDLQSGDRVSVIAGWTLTFKWRPIVVYAPSDISLESEGISLDDCARLGIKVLFSINQSTFKDVTHYLAKTLSPTPLQVVSLVHNAHLVTPAWLARVVYLSKLPHVPLTQRSGISHGSDVNLVDNFVLPSEAEYIPPPDNTTMSDLPYPWPQVDRIDLLKGYSFSLVSSKARSSLDTKALYASLEMVSGRPTTFDIAREESEKGSWAAHLATAQRKAADRMKENGKEGQHGLFLVADEEDLKRICGRDVWETAFVTAAESINLCFLNPAALLEAIIKNDASGVLASSTSTPGTEKRVEKRTEREEGEETPATQAPPRRKLTRRAGNSAFSREASAAPEETPTEEKPTPEAEAKAESESQLTRRPLRRRAKAGISPLDALLGIDTLKQEETKPTPVAESSTKTSEASASEEPIKSEPATQRLPPRSRLKRRAGQSQIENPHLAAIEEEIKAYERPTKKLKALFDAADPDRFSPIPELAPKPSEKQSKSTSNDRPGLESQLGPGNTELRPSSVPEDAVGVPEDAAAKLQSNTSSSQPKLASRKRPRTAADEMMDLDTITEEENVETALLPPTQRRRRGRSASMQPPSSTTTTPARKKRAIEGVRAVEPDGDSRAILGTVPEESAAMAMSSPSRKGSGLLRTTTSRIVRDISPDRDEEFLKELADLKTRHSKKNEKETDKDFKAVRSAGTTAEEAGDETTAIAGAKKATPNEAVEGRDWVLLDDMKLDYGIRGNFMRIVEFEVLGEMDRENQQPSAAPGSRDSQETLQDEDARQARVSNTTSNGRWEGRPNFKAFRRNRPLVLVTNTDPPLSQPKKGKASKNTTGSGKVELVLQAEPDYGEGSAYMPKNLESMQWQSQPSQHPDAEVFTYTRAGVMASQNQNHEAAKQNRTGTTKTKAKGKGKEPAGGSQPLFLDSDEERDPDPTLMSDDPDLTLRSAPAQRTRTAPRRAAKGKGRLVESDGEESDEELIGNDTAAARIVDDLEMDMDSSPAKTKAGAKAGAKDGAKTTKKKGKPLREDDSSDDGMTFGGLGGKRKATKRR